MAFSMFDFGTGTAAKLMFIFTVTLDRFPMSGTLVQICRTRFYFLCVVNANDFVNFQMFKYIIGDFTIRAQPSFYIECNILWQMYALLLINKLYTDRRLQFVL
jgi:hypothetical protein